MNVFHDISIYRYKTAFSIFNAFLLYHDNKTELDREYDN